MAYYIKLPDGGPLPKIKGASDAKHAMWVSFRDIANSQEVMFEDHLDIIGHFTGI
jgi:bifunctional NMN adenylyltransferase/nudix hydrolase